MKGDIFGNEVHDLLGSLERCQVRNESLCYLQKATYIFIEWITKRHRNLRDGRFIIISAHRQPRATQVIVHQGWHDTRLTHQVHVSFHLIPEGMVWREVGGVNEDMPCE